MMNIEYVDSPPGFADFYEFQLVAGEMLTDDDPETMVLINESAVKAFGWHNPIGMHFGDYSVFTVKGVIKNVYNLGPIIPAEPACYYQPSSLSRDWPNSRTIVLFEYQKGMWQLCKEKIKQMLMENEDLRNANILNTEKEYDKYLKSENSLLKLLSFVSAVCILICVFGFVSLVSLTCEERRKEIAIRKINGATSRDILAIFVKEYALLLIIGSAIAFTTGYFIMHQWIEHYVKQTTIPAWIFLSIFCAMALVIAACVGWQVYKASIANPAEVVKSE